MKGGKRLLSFTLMAALVAALLSPMAMAAPVPSQTTCVSETTVDEQAIAAERDLIKAKLTDFGLTEKQAADRVELLTDQEVHAVAADLDSLQTAGAVEQWDTTTVLLLLILVAILAS